MLRAAAKRISDYGLPSKEGGELDYRFSRSIADPRD
jgi:hypothetical protein